MSHVQDYVVQLFDRGDRGVLSTAGIRQCSSPDGAKRLAERLVREKRAAGALAYSRPGAISASEFSSPTVLARIGDVPEIDAY
ncbi:hypothetical protein [Methylobacterium sp. B1]|uniref:hypothetical protein n=1 Tax=Methylobacterium sp. B1 TaxID=91459 RepID=UPI0011D244E5|nr:hypothetical protein [Methylobacterium sp. B1]